jgi:hypothetical protein
MTIGAMKTPSKSSNALNKIPPSYLLDAGFLAGTLASIRLSSKTTHANHFFSAFLACAG